jgi:hypothetical protein
LDNGTIEAVPRPVDRRVISSRYVFKKKTDENGAISKYKTRIVARGFLQTHGIDFFESFSPTLRMDSKRYLMA